MQPVEGAIEAFLVIMNNLPYSVRALIGLALVLFCIPLIVQLVLRFRG